MARNRSMQRTRNRRNKRCHSRSKRGGGSMDYITMDDTSKDNILVDEIKKHIGKPDGSFPNLDTIMLRALNDKTLQVSATNDNNDEYRTKVIEYLNTNWTKNGEVLGSSPRHPAAAAADPYDSDSDYDSESEGGKSRRRRRHSRRHRRRTNKIRKSRKGRKMRRN